MLEFLYKYLLGFPSQNELPQNSVIYTYIQPLDHLFYA